MLFQSAHKGKSHTTVLTSKFQLMVIVFMLFKGTLRVETFTTLCPELYIVVRSMVFI